MCGRYTITKDPIVLQALLDYICMIPLFLPRYNVAPTQQAPVIVQDNHVPALKLLKWGLIPSFAKDEAIGLHNINARVETLSEKHSFRSAIKTRRCLVPADSFFEWKQAQGHKQPFRILPRNADIFCFAGLWARWHPPAQNTNELPYEQVVESFTIITAPANEAIQPMHSRMPVILEPEMYKCWLDEESAPEAYLSALNQPSQAPLKIYPVSVLVNNTRNDSPGCLEPVEIETDLFEGKWWG